MESDNCKLQKEMFVTGHSGSGHFEVQMAIKPLLLVLPTIHVLHNALGMNFYNKWLTFTVEFSIALVVQIFAITLFNDYLYTIDGLLVLLLILTYFQSNLLPKQQIKSNENVPGRDLPLTALRGIIFYITLAAILAVDFHVFPRRYVKTENYGFSLMDTGTSSYLISNGIVSTEARLSSSKFVVFRDKFKRLVVTVLPLMGLGLLRLTAVAVSGYHTHVSEYGLHWNFFFTMAVVRVLSFVLFLIFPADKCVYLALSTALLQELFLTGFGWKTFVLSDDIDRTDLLTANKEGIFSSIGYLSIYLFGISLGHLHLSQNGGKHKMLIVTLLMWTATFGSNTFVDQCSRRMANLTYIMWTVSIYAESLTLLTYMEMAFKRLGQTMHVPVFLRAINEHGLAFFIGGNVLTGLINLTLRTEDCSNVLAMVIISEYMALLCVIVFCMHSWKAGNATQKKLT